VDLCRPTLVKRDYITKLKKKKRALFEVLYWASRWVGKITERNIQTWGKSYNKVYCTVLQKIFILLLQSHNSISNNLAEDWTVPSELFLLTVNSDNLMQIWVYCVHDFYNCDMCVGITSTTAELTEVYVLLQKCSVKPFFDRMGQKLWSMHYKCSGQQNYSASKLWIQEWFKQSK